MIEKKTENSFSVFFVVSLLFFKKGEPAKKKRGQDTTADFKWAQPSILEMGQNRRFRNWDKTADS